MVAFKDITKVLYDGAIQLDYKDKAHRYYVRERVNWDLPEDDKKAWGKVKYPKGTTTLLGDTLEKKGLMTWPMGMALQELFGFYDFTGSDGVKKTGFSKDKGTLWTNGNLMPVDKETALPLVLSASKNWTRRQKKGADIGSVVHDAIEHHVKGEPFNILEVYTESTYTYEYDTEKDREEAIAAIAGDVAQAELAYGQFVQWWAEHKPELVGAEELIYSREHNISGTFDGLIRFNGKLILCDWKTSNASSSKEAAMPEGINYQYFIQSAIYAMAWAEMGNEMADDLGVISCRKDGGFTALFASDLGLTVEDCINWAKAVILAYRLAEKTKAGLIAHAEEGTK